MTQGKLSRFAIGVDLERAAERFGLIAHGEEPPELAHITALIGREPDLYEEFDVLA